MLLEDALKSRTLSIAHRGARSIAPENTPAAARKAIEAGADMWELDVAMTADGELIVVHDVTLERTSNVREIFPDRAPWRVQDFTLEEARRLDFGSWFEASDPFGQIAAGEVAPEDLAAFAGIKAPTLCEALEFTRENRWLVNVEIKDLSGAPGDETVVEKTAALIDSLGMAGSVLISSFNHGYLLRMKKASPAIATGALVESAHEDPLALVRWLNARTYHPRLVDVVFSGLDMGALASLGCAVLVWTVNDEASMEAMIRAGAAGVFTDFPQRLSKVLKRSG